MNNPFVVRYIAAAVIDDTNIKLSPNDTFVFTVAAALIFIFTSFVFLAYDCLVAYRQKIVMQRAEASSAIVSSLFPKNVRQSLYDENDEKKKQEAGKNNFLNSSELRAGITPSSSKPIADEFDETTIFFADLVGFTSWSSNRTPTQVFELLEAVYGAFDKIAKRRGVFKVETIGTYGRVMIP